MSLSIRVLNEAERNDRNIVYRLAEILADAVYPKPWCLTNWNLGTIDDQPNAYGSVMSYILFFLEHDSDIVVFEDSTSIVGFGLGTVFNEITIQGAGLLEGIDCDFLSIMEEDQNPEPVVGDYYLVAAAIQGELGIGNRKLKSYRGIKVKDKSAYKWLTEIRVKLAAKRCIKRFWVRTHTEQTIVINVHKDLGFRELGISGNQHVGDQHAPRTLMFGKTNWIPNFDKFDW